MHDHTGIFFLLIAHPFLSAEKEKFFVVQFFFFAGVPGFVPQIPITTLMGE